MPQTFLRARNAVLSHKIETTEGVENAPDPATDSVKIENLRVTSNPRILSTNEHSNSIDGSEDLVGGMTVGLSFNVIVKGSGVAGTPPEIGDLLKICGFAETITAAAIPAAPEACAAGSSQTVATLGTTASAIADIYNGMPIEFTGGVIGQSVIADYDASKNATLTDDMGAAIDIATSYQIPINVLYSPASLNLPTSTFHASRDGIRYRFAGCGGNVSLGMPSGDTIRFAFNITGIYLGKDDNAVPANVAFDQAQKLIFKNGVMKIDRAVARVNTFSLNTNNVLTNPDNPGQEHAYDHTIITDRKITGSVDPTLTLKATRDLFTDMLDGNKRIISARVGSVAGNRLAVTVPQARITGNDEGEREGILTEGVNFQAPDTNSGMYICFY